MIFTYWYGDTSVLDPFVTDWEERIVAPIIYQDADVVCALEGVNISWVDFYRRIRIPACRSDVARLALLYQHGGLYVDAHAGDPDTRLLAALFAKLAEVELVVMTQPTPPDNTIIPYQVVNGALLARCKSEIVKGLLSTVMTNLIQHTVGQPYNIAALTGAWAIRMSLFLTDRPQLVLPADYSNRVRPMMLGIGEPQPFRFYRHYGYRKPGDHWSERQNSEPLFDTDSIPTVEVGLGTASPSAATP